MVIGGSSESGATTESHPGRQPQIAVNPDAAPWPQSATDIDIGDTSFSLTRRTDLPGLAPGAVRQEDQGSEPR
jgi:hypothetical protein